MTPEFLTIENYPWADFWFDYRLATYAHMLWSPLWHKFGLPDSIWAGVLKAGMLVWDDLELEEFMEE